MSLPHPACAASPVRATLVHPARAAREAVGLTRSHLARHMRVTARTLARYERTGCDEVAARRGAAYMQAVSDRRGLGQTIKMDIFLPDLTKPAAKK